MRSIAVVIAFLTLKSITGTFAQSGNITGVVTDKATNDRIPFANVVANLKSNTASSKGTVSDKDGKFSLDNLPFGNNNVVISFIG
jgi:hypothetical protein